MNIRYFDKHTDEFDAITQALKGEMERIWGEYMKEQGESLDNRAVYLGCFEELQYNFSPESFAKLNPAQVLDKDKIAAFVARTRDYQHGITIQALPGCPQKWLKARIKPLEPAEGINLCWIDTARIVTTGAGQQFNDQFYLTVTADDGNTYRVSDVRLPGRLLNNAHEKLFKAMASTNGGTF
ncbi:hypothetical protein C6H65_19660 [Photorhabdus luminescens]|nr:hypothetical protein C6H65_19660 [Photorhabdus luminescens]